MNQCTKRTQDTRGSHDACAWFIASTTPALKLHMTSRPMTCQLLFNNSTPCCISAVAALSLLYYCQHNTSRNNKKKKHLVLFLLSCCAQKLFNKSPMYNCTSQISHYKILGYFTAQPLLKKLYLPRLPRKSASKTSLLS